jgi:hypothetical protein
MKLDWITCESLIWLTIVGQSMNLSRNYLPTGRQVCKCNPQPYYLIADI